jgi:hypothetical protein
VRFRCFVGAAIIGVLCPALALAQQPAAGARPYDGIQAGLDAFRLAEEQRQAAVANQLAVADQMRAWSGIPAGRGATIDYGYAAPPASLDYAYAYGGRPWIATGERTGVQPLSVFEPWPIVPGDIYGYVYFRPLRQPAGQWQGQTGPRRWESHPVHDPPLPNYQPLPPVESPLLDHTPYAVPRRVVPGRER